MKHDEALSGVKRLFLDTSPVIYYVEGVSRYYETVRRIFERVGRNEIAAVSSPITLAECLVAPLKQSLPDLVECFKTLLSPPNTNLYVGLDDLAENAARFCARYGLRLPDGFQFATAISSGCDAFLTNDKKLKRVTELPVLVVDDLMI
jgi:predicted nucleic acid-binding protein